MSETTLQQRLKFNAFVTNAIDRTNKSITSLYQQNEDLRNEVDEMKEVLVNLANKLYELSEIKKNDGNDSR